MKVKRTKAKLIAVLALVLGLSTCCAVFAASAAEKTPVTGDEFTTPTPAVYESNFDSASGEVHNATPFWGNAALSFETENPINGTKSVKAHADGDNVGAIFVATNKIIAQAGQKFAFSFKVKVVDLTKAMFVSNFGTYAELTYQNGAWSATAAFLNFKQTAGEGYVLIEFEKDMTTVDNANGTLLGCYTWGTGDLIIDDFKIVDTGVKANTYYTVQYGSDFETETGDSVFDATPFWGNDISWETGDYVINGNRSVKYACNSASQIQIGGITYTELMTKPNKLYKYSFKFMSVGLSKVTFVTLSKADQTGDVTRAYTEINYENNGFAPGSGINDFSAVKNGDFYEISYLRTVDDGGNDDFKIYATGTGSLWIDDFVCAYKDNAPSTAVAEKDYLMNHPADVAFTLNLKENEITSVNVNNEALATDNYTVAENVLTVKKEYLATLAAGTELEVTVATAGGELVLTVNVIDDKTEITAITGITAENKVYDGTATATVNVTGAQFTGIEAGDVLTLTYESAAFESAGAGSGKTIVLTGVALGGANANKYVLANGLTVSITADITVKTVSVTGVTAENKTYDKTVNAVANTSAAVINGLVDGDDVTVSATALFADANAGADKNVAVTVALSGDDAANYALESDTLSLTANITKKALTVTADEKTVTVGETATLTYTADGLIEGDTLSGELAREEGDTAGVYKITQGTLNNDNYDITFVGADYTINAAPKKGCKSDIEAVYGAAAVLPLMLAVLFIKRKKENS